MSPLVPNLAPGQTHSAETVVKRSRFIATAARVRSPEEAKAFIDSIRREHASATHNCWAFCAGPAGDTAQVGASDDGEPQGTAGRPMLTVLLNSGVGEIACVVTRYFGGTLLGTGGLVRAYQSAVKEVLEGLPTTEETELSRVLVSVDVSLADAVTNLLRRLDAKVVSSDFSFDAAFEAELVPERLPELEEGVAILSSGEGLVEVLDDEEEGDL